MAIRIARRARTSLKGACRWFMRKLPMLPSGSAMSTIRLHARGPALRDRWGGKSAGRGQDADTGRGLDERASIHDSRPVRAQTILATPQKNGSGPGAIPVTFFRQA